MSAELESLSNKELRAKCMEYGLPNVPVTDSSRKLMIRRLAAAMLSGPKDNSSSSGTSVTPSKPGKERSQRRETMHVSKPSEIMAPPPPPAPPLSGQTSTVSSMANEMAIPEKPVTKGNAPRTGRKTIAAVERNVTTTRTVSEPESSDTSPERYPQQPRNIQKPSQSMPQLKQTPKSSIHLQSVSLTSTPHERNLYPNLPIKEPSPKPIQLTKTDVVTTSYVLEKARVDSEPIDVDAYDDDQNSEENVPRKDISLIDLDDYEDGLHLNASRQQNIGVTQFMRTSGGFGDGVGGGSGTSISMGRSSGYVTASNESNYNFNNPGMKHYSTSAAVAPSASTSTSTSTMRPGLSSMARRSYMPAGSSSRTTTTTTTLYEDAYADEDLENDKENNGIGIADVRPQYLSEFARKLEYLKAKPLTAAKPTSKYLTGQDIGDTYGVRSTYSSSHTNPSALRNRESIGAIRSQKFRDFPSNVASSSSSIYTSCASSSTALGGRNLTGVDQNTKGSSLQQFINALNQKYHLKQILLVIAVFVILVFVYVFFIQSI